MSQKVSSVKYPCGVCDKECVLNTIFCVDCKKWYHRQCEFLTAAEMKLLSSIARIEYVCSSCRSDFTTNQLDYKNGLRRMVSYRDNPVNLKAAAEAVYLKRYPELVSLKLRRFSFDCQTIVAKIEDDYKWLHGDPFKKSVSYLYEKRSR
jgi:hypothetical protein